MSGSAPEYLQVQTTTDSRPEAMELARVAVEARLAACAQVEKIESVYTWTRTGTGKGVMVDVSYRDGAKYLPSEEEVKALRPQD